ncbi:41692_t:CDS:2, partial [Gigaspora margarita]
MDTQTTSYTNLADVLDRTKKLLKTSNKAEKLKKQLQQTHKEVDVFQYLYEVIEIANAKHKALFDDV